MPSANGQKMPSPLKEKFGDFCLEVFNSKDNIKNGADVVDCRALHKFLGTILKSSIDSEQSLPSDTTAKEVVYLMAAIADEVFLNMEWPGKQYWEENMLEQRYFGSQIAGEKVFDRIDILLGENDPTSVGKAKIYLKILLLGFKGKYRRLEDEQTGIALYKNNLLVFIEKNDKSIFMIGHRIFQKEYTYTIPTIHRKLLPDASIVSYMCAFFVFMFLVISSVVWIFETRDLKRLLCDISEIALRE
ncbi:MAG: DotU family type IV/VI secretion system protein [Holosporaceae bacterium]|jgi:type IV/VI secretion system ImpK/VasF family protein|nr:DotU family type IV/VI secretion system protein [Holosporaceae bacterium]